ncbi:MAG: AAA family ATPase [Deltaproteobacteria bacterium]|nr:AAA family ATPase [Deltaproteobacteria bacterium]
MSLYQHFFGLDEEPFRITPDPAFLFLSKNHKEAFAHLFYGLRGRSGFIAMTGEVGSGKTTVLRSLFNQLDSEAYRLAYIFNPTLTPEEMLHVICQEFSLDHLGKSRALLFDGLNRFLLTENAAGRTVVLVIDEAQNLGTEALEQVRLLSNLETDKDKLIQIILVGQPELGFLLERTELRQLNQRISVRFHLDALDFEDSMAYVRHRLKLAGSPNPDLFTHRGLKKIYDFSEGYPRLINLVCDRAMLIAYTRESRRIGWGIVRDAVRELGGAFFTGARMGRLLPVIGLAAALFFSIGLLIGNHFRNSEPSAAPRGISGKR